MSESRLKVFTDEEINTIYNTFYECDKVPCGLYDIYNRLLEEFGDEHIVRIGER